MFTLSAYFFMIYFYHTHTRAHTRYDEETQIDKRTPLNCTAI